MVHLLVTNDFPPKIGGIQSYLSELWRRLPPSSAVVVAPAQTGDRAFDDRFPLKVVRLRHRVLLPTPRLRRTVDALAAEVGADLVLLDPALPLGLLGPKLARPFGVVLHGAEVTVPGRLPGSRRAMAGVLSRAKLVVAAGMYPAAEAERAAKIALPTLVVPPGVDVDRFRVLSDDQRVQARRRFGVAADAKLVVSVSRLVPRKGMDVLIEAVSRLAADRPGLVLLIAGVGRDRRRLERLVERTGAPVRFCGRVPDAQLPRLVGSADVFAMLCRDRWMGLEQEGFGIVFLEAAACGVPAVAGLSGGSHEAVRDGETGAVVDDPTDPASAAAALAELLDDEGAARRSGAAGRAWCESNHSYEVLAQRLGQGIGAAMEVTS